MIRAILAILDAVGCVSLLLTLAPVDNVLDTLAALFILMAGLYTLLIITGNVPFPGRTLGQD